MVGYSGKVQLQHTARAIACGVLTAAEDGPVQLFQFCELYCIRISDGAMAYGDPLKEILA